MAKIRAIHRGYCPELDEDYQIEVEYSKLGFLGDPNTYYKKLGYRCAYSMANGCESCYSKGVDCPIFSAAQYP